MLKALDIYVTIFDERSILWTKDRDRNLLLLRHAENYANSKLKVNGYLFLKEVFEILDIPLTNECNKVGWMYDENTYVDFGLDNNINTMDSAFILVFNVDGDIAKHFKGEES